jgi:hypothetical protein
LREPLPSARVLIVWAMLAALGIWFSYAAVFTVAAGGLLLGAAALRAWPLPQRRLLMRASVAIAASAAALIAPVMAQRSGAVVDFWADAFPDLTQPLSSLAWLIRAIVGLFDYFWQPFGAVMLLGAALAVPVWWRSARGPLALLWLPVLLSLCAAAARWWPFGGNQHMVFAVPAVLILAAEGIELARRRAADRDPRLAAAALLILLAPAVLGAFYRVAVPRQRHAMRPVIEYAMAREQPGDGLAVFDPATFAFYSGRDARALPATFGDRQRVWVITPRSKRGELHPDVARLIAELEHSRPRLEIHEAYGAAAYLFGPAGVTR